MGLNKEIAFNSNREYERNALIELAQHPKAVAALIELFESDETTFSRKWQNQRTVLIRLAESPDEVCGSIDKSSLPAILANDVASKRLVNFFDEIAKSGMTAEELATLEEAEFSARVAQHFRAKVDKFLGAQKGDEHELGQQQ